MTSDAGARAARRLWTRAEALHALTYFAPESHAAFEAAGLRGFWRGYFAGRAAPLGPVPAAVVTATFFGFHPDFVARAIPSVWSLTTPADAVAARLDGIDAALTRIGLGPDAPVEGATPAIAAVRRAVDAAPHAGRPLYAANVALEWPGDDRLALWHAATLLREHRGDGHVAALVAADLDPCAAHVLRIAADDLPLDSIQPYRGWTDDDWAGAARRLTDRGLLGADGHITTAGAAARIAIEAATDRAAAELVERIEDVDAVIATFDSVAERVGADGDVPYPNPIGVPPPDRP
jgi:hypothetical protein